MSCARVKKYTASDVSKAERHNERKNETYENMNVIEERIPYNVHFKKPVAPTYMEQLKRMETDGMVSLRGLRKDATLFNEIVIDVNTMYFERNGGYEYAKQFYEEAFHFIEEKFGADNVISAVMHADEINVAATEELGKEVYHYHLHAMVLPVVEKEILWSKRCKDEKLRGTVKEVVHQISHSKKWKSDIPLTDEKGNPLLRKNGKPMFRASYSILQDELFNYMTERGFKGFQRGEYGSTAEHLTSLQYQIKQDKERLEKLQKRIQREQIKYEPARNVSKTYNEIDSMGQKTITGKKAISKEDYSQLTALAKEGITSRAEIKKFEQSATYYRQKYMDSANALERMKTKYNELKEKCRPFLQALEHFPEVAKLFTEKVKQLFSFKEAQERAEKEAREKERQERIKARRNKRGMMIFARSCWNWVFPKTRSHSSTTPRARYRRKTCSAKCGAVRCVSCWAAPSAWALAPTVSKNSSPCTIWIARGVRLISSSAKGASFVRAMKIRKWTFTATSPKAPSMPTCISW